MLPLRLKLSNFLPYRNPDTLHFEGIDLACLTGQNGAGKSSLLDAMTWALWGKARGKRDDDLVHQGQAEMYVQLDFEQEQTVYRVIRKRRSGRSGQGSLDLYILQDGGELKLINEPAMRQTQSKIDEILRLDYQTFVNSAFLQQGQADAFTTKTPAERKKILSDILGLEQWAVYEERVKIQVKSLETTLASIDYSLREIDNELRKEGQYRTELQAAHKAYEIAELALKDAEARLEEVKDASADLRNAREQAIKAEQRLKNYQQDLKQLEADIQRRHATIASYQAILERAESIEAGYQTLQTMRETDKSLDDKMREIRNLEKREREIQKQLEQARSQLEREIQEQRTIITEAERSLRENVSEELAEVQFQITALQRLDNERHALMENVTSLREERSSIDALHKILKNEGKDLNERIETLEHAADDAVCPLCGQALNESHLIQILGELNEERDFKRGQYADATARLKSISDEGIKSQAELDLMAKSLADLPRLQAEAGKLQQTLDASNAAQMRLNAAQTRLDALSATLQTEDYAHDIRQALAEIHQEQEVIGYDESEHETIQAQLEQLGTFEKEHTQLEIARAGLKSEEEVLESKQKQAEKIQQAQQEEELALFQQADVIKSLELREKLYFQRQQEVAQARTAQANAREKVTIAEQQLAALERQRKRKQDLESEREYSEIQQGVYKELQMAFGKNGVPAMIIETALPELEASSNDLLSRMTDGRMNLKISTQREKISGGVMETLDIEISDELGTRPYEMYSGGEAFRINFAVRIALSKMLARRAGAHLRTLFIDEGFGTQDDDGRNKLIEAINLIKPEFDMILVITHIDELRDAFPVHIVVEKTANGSRVAIQ